MAADGTLMRRLAAWWRWWLRGPPEPVEEPEPEVRLWILDKPSRAEEAAYNVRVDRLLATVEQRVAPRQSGQATAAARLQAMKNGIARG